MASFSTNPIASANPFHESSTENVYLDFSDASKTESEIPTSKHLDSLTIVLGSAAHENGPNESSTDEPLEVDGNPQQSEFAIYEEIDKTQVVNNNVVIPLPPAEPEPSGTCTVFHRTAPMHMRSRCALCSVYSSNKDLRPDDTEFWSCRECNYIFCRKCINSAFATLLLADRVERRGKVNCFNPKCDCIHSFYDFEVVLDEELCGFLSLYLSAALPPKVSLFPACTTCGNELKDASKCLFCGRGTAPSKILCFF
jgi:hypothetical protein